MLYQKILSLSQKTLQKRLRGKKPLIPPLVPAFIQKSAKRVSFFIRKNRGVFLSFFLAVLISDLLLIKSQSLLLPDKELQPVRLTHGDIPLRLSPDQHKDIWESNIFHTGPIPLQLEEAPLSLEPQPSSLPFKLKGTIIHANPGRSVATVTAGLKTLSYQRGDIIEKQAEVREILRAKLIFFNQNNNRLEYIVIPEEKKPLQISYARDKPRLKAKTSRLVKRKGNSFQVKRSDINDYLQKLPEILKQARVIPHRSKEGQVIGFRFSFIDKNSILREELGFEKGDIIKEANGEAVRTPEKALELYERLKSSHGVKILVERDGKDMYYEYNVNENAPIL